MKTVLTIAGSDCSGGAGIQADIKTISAHGVYAMSAITAITAQNTLGVTAISEISSDMLEKQLDAVFTDIFPDAVKIGMVSSPELIEVIADRIKFYKPKNIVLDTVMVSTSGSALLKKEALSALTEKLIPLADLITPNIPEAENLSGIKISSEDDMEKASRIIKNRHNTAVLCKGGHGINDSNDYLLDKENNKFWFKGKRINNPNTHGTGCTLSSAIASELSLGKDMKTAIQFAKEYITKALEYGLNLGHGSGPLNHMFEINKIKGE